MLPHDFPIQIIIETSLQEYYLKVKEKTGNTAILNMKIRKDIFKKYNSIFKQQQYIKMRKER